MLIFCIFCAFSLLEKAPKDSFFPAGRTGVALFAKAQKKLLFAKRGWATAVARGTIALFTDEKRGKSHQRKAPRPPLQTTSHPVESAAKSNARQVCAMYGKSKMFLSISHHIISHTARANTVCRKKRADSTGWVVPRRSHSYAPRCRLNSTKSSMA